MKKVVIVILTLMLSSASFSQRILKWSIGEIELTCGDPVIVSYQLMVSINDQNGGPVLGASTIRFIYDSKYLLNLKIQNVQNGYTTNGLSQSNPVLGEIFGFSNLEGVFVQFDLMDNARVNPLSLTTIPVHVLDISFEIDRNAKYPLFTPIVLDNNPDSWGQGIAKDDGFIPGSAGIVGSYFLLKNYTMPISADDEVINFSWENLKGFKGKISKGKKVGFLKKEFRIKNSCLGPDCDDDGIPDKQEIDANNNGIPDDCEKNSHGNGQIQKDINSLFTAYPVPFDDEIFVKYSFDYETDVTIEIFDTKGSLIRKLDNKAYEKGEFYQQRIDMSYIDNQLFFLKLTTNQATDMKKIVSSSDQRID